MDHLAVSSIVPGGSLPYIFFPKMHAEPLLELYKSQIFYYYYFMIGNN